MIEAYIFIGMRLVLREKKMSVSSNGHIRFVRIDQKGEPLLSLEGNGMFNETFCEIYIANGSYRLG